MTALVLWLLQRRYRLLIIAVAVTPLLPLLGSALIALDTIRRGPYQGLVSAAIAMTGVIALSAVVGFDVKALGVIGVLTMFSGLGLGTLIHGTYSLALAFQVCLVLCVAAVVVCVAIWPDVRASVEVPLETVLDTLRQEGVRPEFLDAVSRAAEVIYGLFAAFAFAQLIVAAVLAYWWASLAGMPGQIGAQFRGLKLGRSLGVPATLVMAVSLFVDMAIVQNLFPVVLIGFCFQGLAVVHHWAHSRHWNPALLLVMYLLLVSPLSGAILLALASMGLTDNWINLRGPLRAAR